MFDILAAITLTTGAAIVAALYSILFGTTVRERLAIAAGLLVWFGIVVGLGATKILLRSPDWTPPGLGMVVVLPIVTLSVLLLGTAEGRRRVRAVPLSALIGVQFTRNLGFWFVLLFAAGRLPAPFAPVAGWGDMLAGTLAVPAAWLALQKSAGAKAGMIAWSMIGAADLFAAVTLGLMSLPGPFGVFTDAPGSFIMNTLPWILIPGFLVPCLLTLHFVVFYRLLAPTSKDGG